MNANLYDVLIPPALQHSAVVVLQTETGHLWSRHDISDLSARIATLLQQSGIRPGDRVAAQVEKSVEAVCLYLGCLKVGAVYLPLNSGYTSSELSHFLADAEPKAFIKGADGGSLPNVVPDMQTFTLGHDGAGTLIEKARTVAPIEETVARGPSDLAAILYTSGTTGRPKGAMITHGNLSSMASALAKAWLITENDKLLHALPIFHAHGLFIALNTALYAGASITFLRKFSLDLIAEHLPRSTLFMGVPTFYSRMLSDPRINAGTCKGIRAFICGSAPLSAVTFEAFRAKTGHAIVERYAMTETLVITSNPVEGPVTAGSVGYALPDVSLKLTDDVGREASRGDVGEIVLKGPNVFKGYWRLPEVTSKEFTSDGYFKTGDLGKIDPDGRLSVVGRSKDLIITGGYNVYPSEVEAVVTRIDGVADCAVIGLPHPDFGEGVIAVIEPRRGYEDMTVESIIAVLSQTLARYKIPKSIVFVESLPRNAMGKIQKNELRHSYRSMFVD